ncbi:ABC1-domain-containing protein [Atractiella rhizophila]|nr:ABC1-domain-containing protein [Atractiella rhizophila]
MPPPTFQPQSQSRSPPRTERKSMFRLIDIYLLEPTLTCLRFVHLTIIFLPVLLSSPLLILEWFSKKEQRRLVRRKKGDKENGANGEHDGNGELGTTKWWYGLLVNSMERAGPTFIKLAQWAGSRTDLFPPTLCSLFGRLHSQGTAHSLHYTRKRLEEAFGRDFKEIFGEFGEEAVGIGAVAQVYKATLNPDLLPSSYLKTRHDVSPLTPAHVFTPTSLNPSTIPTSTVAIKIIHPRVRSTISRDLKIMSLFASTLNLLPSLQWLSLPEEVEVFGELMQSQLDLRCEAGNLERFEKNFNGRYGVAFPRPLPVYGNQDVLVEEYEEAVPLERFLELGGGPFDERIANLGLDAFLNMLLIDNFAHADLHPGNIMVKFYLPRPPSLFRSLLHSLRSKIPFLSPPPPSNTTTEDDTPASSSIVHHLKSLARSDPNRWEQELESLDAKGYQPELVFIDAGLVTELNDTNRKNFIDLFAAVASFDGYEVGKLMVERCRTPDLVLDDETFALKMQRLVLSIKSKTFSLAQFRLGDLLTDVLRNVRTHHVKLEADFVNTVLSILLLEGIGRQLDPNMDLFKSALPILRQLGRQMGNKEAIRRGAETGSLFAMLKLWIWLEARGLASMATSEVDGLVRDDLLTPNI